MQDDINNESNQGDFNKHSLVYILAIVGAVLVLILICATTFLCYTNAKRQERLKILQAELLATKELDPILPVFDQIDNLSFDQHYEIPLECISVDRRHLKTLGKGQFGIVISGTYKKEGTPEEIVAIKRTRSSWDSEQYRMLFMEICLMVNVGRHPNVVNLIGAVTQISRGHLYMVLEYCANGSLRDFILRKVEESGFDNEIIQDDIKGEMFTRKPYEEKSKEFQLRTADLLSFAYQIAAGMEYVASVKFIHRDLAARNVLLTSDLIAKISDFGLGRQDYQFYEKDKSVLLPIRWLAPEAILYHKFSVRSDVWSFGVTLGEIFSLGCVPFANYTSVNREFAEELSKGTIIPTKPQYATTNIYNLILNCCQSDLKQRWSFTRCKEYLKSELDNCCQELSENLSKKLTAIAEELLELKVREASKPILSEKVPEKMGLIHLLKVIKNKLIRKNRFYEYSHDPSLSKRYNRKHESSENKYV